MGKLVPESTYSTPPHDPVLAYRIWLPPQLSDKRVLSRSVPSSPETHPDLSRGGGGWPVSHLTPAPHRAEHSCGLQGFRTKFGASKPFSSMARPKICDVLQTARSPLQLVSSILGPRRLCVVVGDVSQMNRVGCVLIKLYLQTKRQAGFGSVFADP